MADDESLDQEIEPTPFISKALIGRFLAVGVFVALGTFAVIQSVTGEKDGDAVAAGDELVQVETDGDVEVDGTSKSPIQVAADGVKSRLSGFLKGSPSQSGQSGFAPKTAQLDRPVAKPIASKPSTSFSAASSSGGFSSATARTSKPAASSSGFQIASRPTAKPPVRSVASSQVDPVVKKTAPPSLSRAFSSSSSTTLRPKPPTQKGVQSISAKPPERLAQAPNSGFLPAIGKQGFGATQSNEDKRAALPARPQSGFSGFRSSGSSSSSSNSFSDLKKTVSSGADQLLERTRQAGQKSLDAVAQTGQSARRMLSDSTQSTQRLGSHLSSRVENSAKRFGNSGSSADRFTSKPNGFSSASNGFTTQPNAARQTAPPTVRPPASGGFSSGGFASASHQKNSARDRSSLASSTSRSSSVGTTPRARESQSTSISSSSDLSRRRSPASTPVTQLTRSSNAAVANHSALTLSTPGERRLEGVQAPSLTIEKVSPRQTQVDQPADFEIRVRNVGRVPAADVMVLDRVPSGTEFLGATPRSAPNAGGRLQWDIGTLQPGQEKRIRYQLKPTQPGEIGSVAQVVFATQASMRTVVTKPVLDIQHTTSPQAMMGDNFVFDVTVENRGDGPATDVIIQEEVPEQLEYQAGFRQLEYEVGTLLPGQKRKLRLALKAGKVGKFRNVMFATGKGGLEAKHALDLEVVAPEIRVSSEGPNRRFLQRKATHQFTVENRGTAKATNVDLIARLPSGLKYISADNRGRYDSQSHAVYWKMPQLNDGVAGTVEVTTMPVSVGQQNIKFEAQADLKVDASTEQEMLVEHLTDVFFDIDDVIDPIEVGSQTSYRMRIVNQGTKAASNVQLQVDFPPGLTPESVDGNLRHQIRGQRVIFEPIGALPPGQEIRLSVSATGKAPGDHRVVANIRADGRDVAISKEDTTRVYSDR